MSKSFFFLILLLLQVTLFARQQSNFFANPQPIAIEELSKSIQSKSLDMCWNFGKDSYLRFISKNNEIYFEIFLENLPSCYDDFLSNIRERMIEEENDKGNRCLVFTYRIQHDENEEINSFRAERKKTHPDEYGYIVTERRHFEHAKPKEIMQIDLEEILANNRILFYTGAGLSQASNVPSMEGLHRLLGIEKGERCIYSLEQAVQCPREFASKIRIFHEACLYSPPTEAHCVLKELAFYKNTQIVTENVDCLHERSGIIPYRVDPVQLRDVVGESELAEIDFVICVGLSHDDRGFLGWYKQHNPKGVIVAIDLQRPSYLGDEDLLLLSDLSLVFRDLKVKKLHPSGSYV